MVDPQRLANVFSEFARTLLPDYDLTETLYRLCDAAVELLPISGAGVMLRDARGSLRVVFASDSTVEQLERAQADVPNAPCTSAQRHGAVVAVHDLAADTTFPEFAAAATDLGMAAIFAFPMQTRHEVIGVVDLYRQVPGPLAAQDAAAAQSLADAATALIINARSYAGATELNRQLQHALDSRIVIEQAKGIVSEQLGLSQEKSFDRIRTHARSNRTRISEVVDAIVEGRLHLE